MVALSASLLPNDILHELFCCFEITDPANNLDLGWVRATHVCKSWRDASLGFHSLWARNVCVFPYQIETIMNRAAEAPMAIRGHWRRRLGGISPRTVISLLQHEPSRLALLDFTVSFKLDFLSALSGKSYVNLVDLKIVGELAYPYLHSGTTLVPKLERVSVHQGFLPIIAPRLQTLVLMRIFAQPSYHLSSILDILESSPLLSKIHINGILNDLPASSARVVQLKNATDVDLTCLSQPFIHHICIQYDNRDQQINLTIGGSLSTFSGAISSIVDVVPTCHSIILENGYRWCTFTFQDDMRRIGFRCQYDSDDEEEEKEDTIRAIQDNVTQNVPLEHVCSLFISGFFHHSLSSAFLAVLPNVVTLSSTVSANTVLDDLAEGVFPALRDVIQDSHTLAQPLYTDLSRWESLERFLCARAASGHPVHTLKLTGYTFWLSPNRMHSPTAERFNTQVTEVVDERRKRMLQTHARRTAHPTATPEPFDGL